MNYECQSYSQTGSFKAPYSDCCLIIIVSIARLGQCLA